MNDTWTLKEFRGLDRTCEFASIPVEIPLAGIYGGVEFPETPKK